MENCSCDPSWRVRSISGRVRLALTNMGHENGKQRRKSLVEYASRHELCSDRNGQQKSLLFYADGLVFLKKRDDKFERNNCSHRTDISGAGRRWGGSSPRTASPRRYWPTRVARGRISLMNARAFPFTARAPSIFPPLSIDVRCRWCRRPAGLERTKASSAHPKQISRGPPPRAGFPIRNF